MGASVNNKLLLPPPEITTDVHGCARCGEEHNGLTFKRFTQPINDGTDWNYWVLCPTIMEPVLLRFTPWDDDGVSTLAFAPNPDDVYTKAMHYEIALRIIAHQLTEAGNGLDPTQGWGKVLWRSFEAAQNALKVYDAQLLPNEYTVANTAPKP